MAGEHQRVLKEIYSADADEYVAVENIDEVVDYVRTAPLAEAKEMMRLLLKKSYHAGGRDACVTVSEILKAEWKKDKAK